MLDFLSDNASGLCPEALDALVGSRGGRAAPYGDDDDTARATAAFRDLLGGDVEVFFVATGTAANVLALASLTARWQRIVCEEHAHVAVHEATAPESVTGCRLVTVPAEGRKLTPDALRRRDAPLGRDVHHPAPGAVTISNPTEFGEVYTPEEVAALAEVAHALGYRLHVDGARFANAVAALGCDPRALTTDAGVDALSFGGTKNGLALGEAVVVFPTADGVGAASRLPSLRKSFGHLLSKHRYVSAPFAAVLSDGAWLGHAGHANAMAARLAAGLAEAGAAARFPVETNAVFVPLDRGVREHLTGRGWVLHLAGPPEWQLARFVTSFDTSPDRVDALVADVAAAGAR